MTKRLFFLFFVVSFCIGCIDKAEHIASNADPIALHKLQFDFQELGSDETGINFTNKVFESDELNYFTYEYLYNGGGVSIADFDNDGLDDLFFTCNMGFNRIYKNNGALKFEDKSKTSNIRTARDWSTGTTVADVNSDGLLDIYVSRSGWFDDPELRSNLLYINQGDFQFREASKDYGIDDRGYTTQSAFFDADGDGDLDLYVMNHPKIFSESLDDFLAKDEAPQYYESDHLYINEDGHFVNKSKEWGVENYGHGLGLVVSDLNSDGKLDLYISNDYQQHDFVYINTGSKFVEKSSSVLDHMSKFSMGVDASDFNNDSYIDVMAVEMMPAENYRKKTNMANMNPELYQTFKDNGLQDQEMHNSLQVNSGSMDFSEQAYLRGVAETDWSWAPLFADFDGDLQKDLFITNGYRRDVLNKDISKTIEKKIKKETFRYSSIKDFYKSHLSQNQFFKNENGSFLRKSESGFNTKFNSNGAAYSDLDNDGDLDIVCNNMEYETIVYENLSNPSIHSEVSFIYKEDTHGLGAVLKFRNGDRTFTYENNPTRGFQSSVPPYLLIPNFDLSSVSTVEVSWPDGVLEDFEVLPVSGSYKLVYGKGLKKKRPQKEIRDHESSISVLNYKHKEKEYDDFKKQPLLLHKLSNQGPEALSTDLNQDNIDELIITGSTDQLLSIFNFENGAIEKSQFNLEPISNQKIFEDSGICVFDLNGDGLQDIYVSRGSYESATPKEMSDVIYINKGDSFAVMPSPIKTNTKSPLSIDIDDDGDEDIFVGGGVIPGQYPVGSESYFLRNENGKLVLEQIKELSATIINDAVAFDLDDNGTKEIILVGDWMKPQVLEYVDHGWQNSTNNYIPDTMHGLWKTIYVADINQDGREEILLGNIGLNSKYRATKQKPFNCYSADFDENGSFEVVLSTFENDKEFPVRGKQCSSEQLPELISKIETYDIFANLEVEDIYGEGLSASLKYYCNNLQSGYLTKVDNNTKYRFVDFGMELQKSAIFSFGVSNSDDSCPLILASGNIDLEVESGRLDGFELIIYDECSKTRIDEIKLGKNVKVRDINKINDSTFLVFTAGSDALLLSM